MSDNALAPAPDCLEARQAIITLANSLIGSHYLWGSAGNMPSLPSGDNVPYRANAATMAPSRLDPKSPCVFAAQCSVAGYQVCSGRFDAPHEAALWPGGGGPAGGIPGGRRADLDAGDKKELADYLATLKAGDEANWQPYCKIYTPRKVVGANVAANGWIVWGEDCRTKRHFDCIGFVNYCYMKTYPNAGFAQCAIDNWASGSPGANPIPKLSNPPTASQLLPADILIQSSVKDEPVLDKTTKEPVKDKDGNPVTQKVTHYHHIGLYDGNNGVVQAEQSSTGVLTRTYLGSQWQVFRRVPCAKLQ